MEKRILLAFVLSFMVLSLWTSFVAPDRKAVNKESRSFGTENKENIKTIVSPAPSMESLVAQNISQREQIVVLENEKIKIEFSNIGGSIKSVTIKEFNASLPITKVFSLKSFENKEFLLTKNSNDEITYSWTKGNEKVIKTYVLSNQDYLIETNVQTKGMSNLDINGYTVDSSVLNEKISHSPERSLFEYSVGLINQNIRKNNAIEFNAKENKSQEGEVSWLGYRDRYFCFVLKPKFKTERFSILAEDSKKLSIGLALADKSMSNCSAVMYIGPQNLKLLAGYNKGFENIMVFSNWPMLDIFAKLIYFFIHFLHKLLGSWGAAILLLGVSLFTITYPLTAKSMVSMRKMQALQPKMKALQEKYKNDPQRLNKEMMELYKENGVNPFGGCLPMVLQMPIFYGLYQVLWRSVDFKGTRFLWIKDLSLPDRLVILPYNLPFLGNELNVLPILMAIIMFFQQKFTSRNMVITDENQMMQQKMMAGLMPIMMGFIFYHFAGGLCLYFTVFYLLSTLAQWKMSKQKIADVQTVKN